MWITYIDETVVQGTAYGFEIGDSKSETYTKAKWVLLKLSDSGITPPYIEVKVNNENEELLATKSEYDLLVQTLLHDVGYDRFIEKDVWRFYIDGSYFNSISLKFCQNKLCEIHRHRKYFEMP
ncbi:hypothetical protein TspCOW1_27010 [Thiohalobacter sp. COW1]|nr:hypothetical protein TspCOW1_27010 [Thiohalobacter sp. COW1]